MDKNKKLLSPLEVANILSISKRTVYEIIKRNELKAYKVGNKFRIDLEDVKEYMGRNENEIDKGSINKEIDVDKSKYSFNELYKNYIEDKIVICGQDSIIDTLSSYLGENPKGTKILRLYDNSFNGLCALYNGDVQITASHIWNSETNDYNIEYAKRMLPGISTTIINLCYRTQGFYVQKGNPKKINDWKDLIKDNVMLINRELGSGSRILLDESLKKYKINKANIKGYNNYVSSHREIVKNINSGKADVGVGLKKYINNSYNIDFIPMHKERYDLIVKTEDLEKAEFKEILKILKKEEFKNEFKNTEYYDFSDMGKIIAIT